MTDIWTDSKNDAPPSGWYVQAMEHLVKVVHDLSQARELNSVISIVRQAARALTGADGATFILRDGNKCYYVDEDAISPLWKGQRFPIESCISGWSMLNAEAVVIDDIYEDPRIPHDAYRPTFVKSLAMVPIRKEDPVGAIGNYWATKRHPTREEVEILQALADITSVALENVNLYAELQDKLRALEQSNYELSRFAWAASHDLKSPLRSIHYLSQWIEEELGETLHEKGIEYLKKIKNRIAYMERLLDDILKYSEISQKTDVALEEMVDGRSLLSDLLGLIDLPQGFVIKVGERFSAVRVPRMPLQRIFYNLIDNALRYHDKKAGQINIDVTEDDKFYTFSIHDDGPGISPEYQEKIFEMFQTLQTQNPKENSGMGLAFIKKTLALNGGSITVESDLGKGTTFYFTWPKILTSLTR